MGQIVGSHVKTNQGCTKGVIQRPISIQSLFSWSVNCMGSSVVFQNAHCCGVLVSFFSVLVFLEIAVVDSVDGLTISYKIHKNNNSMIQITVAIIFVAGGVILNVWQRTNHCLCRFAFRFIDSSPVTTCLKKLSLMSSHFAA